jgi:hypothetical protein
MPRKCRLFGMQHSASSPVLLKTRFALVHATQRDPTIMNNTVLLAKQNGVRIGAHPSLPDRQGFGRREMQMEPVS